MSNHGSNQNQAMADLANAGANACLPRDVLASILLGLPASDLRRFRRVCKEWREVISDPAFIDEHTVHGPRDLNHTIVFFPTRRYAEEPPNGSGFLFDEQWRLTATFTAGRSEDMIGTCNGLLCFLNGDQGSINIMEPFTGESLALPLSPETKQQREESSTYCFGFDHSSRRYKIVHGGFYVRRDDTMNQELQVYTVEGGENWRSVHVADAAEHDLVGVPVYADGVVYWSVRGEDWVMKLACLDLATEEVTWEGLDPEPSAVGPDAGAEHDGGAGRTAARVCVMIMRGRTHSYWTVLFAGQGGHWVPDSVELPPLRRPSLPQPLQRGHLLLEDYTGGGNLCAHPVVPASNDVGSGKLLLKRDKKEELPKEQAKSSSTGQHADRTPSCNTRALFIPALFNQAHAGIVGRIPHQQGYAVTFCYAPPVSPAPLAHYFGKL